MKSKSSTLVSPSALTRSDPNTKSRRDKLTPDQLAALAEHGIQWA
ncbi:hypothetical protein AB0K51_31790 [Kitasatospora sp. NPDC049285]